MMFGTGHNGTGAGGCHNRVSYWFATPPGTVRKSFSAVERWSPFCRSKALQRQTIADFCALLSGGHNSRNFAAFALF